VYPSCIIVRIDDQCFHQLSCVDFFLKNLQIPPAPTRVGEAEPPPSWDPVSTPKGETLAVMC
jgi:hypothetical protein